MAGGSPPVGDVKNAFLAEDGAVGREGAENAAATGSTSSRTLVRVALHTAPMAHAHRINALAAHATLMPATVRSSWWRHAAQGPAWLPLCASIARRLAAALAGRCRCV